MILRHKILDAQELLRIRCVLSCRNVDEPLLDYDSGDKRLYSRVS